MGLIPSTSERASQIARDGHRVDVRGVARQLVAEGYDAERAGLDRPEMVAWLSELIARDRPRNG